MRKMDLNSVSGRDTYFMVVTRVHPVPSLLPSHRALAGGSGRAGISVVPWRWVGSSALPLCSRAQDGAGFLPRQGFCASFRQLPEVPVVPRGEPEEVPTDRNVTASCSENPPKRQIFVLSFVYLKMN